MRSQLSSEDRINCLVTNQSRTQNTFPFFQILETTISHGSAFPWSKHYRSSTGWSLCDRGCYKQSLGSFGCSIKTAEAGNRR